MARPVLTVDAELHNADWTKQSWDLPYRDVVSLRAALAADGKTVAQFKALPVYRQNIGALPWLKDL